MVLQSGQCVLGVARIANVVCKGELVTTLEPHTIAGAANRGVGDLFFFQSEPSVSGTLVFGFVLPRIVVVLALLVGGQRCEETGFRLFEIVVGQRCRSGVRSRFGLDSRYRILGLSRSGGRQVTRFGLVGT